MKHSWAKPTRVCCSECGETYDFDVWVIVDITERPDLAQRIRSPSILNSLHIPTCPTCGTWGFLLDEPLLLYCPGKAPPLLFSPAESKTAEEDWNLAVELVGHALRKRFEVLRGNGDLDAAIAAYRQAVDESDYGSSDRVAASGGLAGGLLRRFEEKHQRTDLDTAIDTIQQILTEVGDGSSEWALEQNNLGVALLARFDADHQAVDLDGAIDAFKHAISAADDRSADWAHRQAALGEALFRRYEILRRNDDLTDAIAAYERALDILDPNAWPAACFNVANRLGRVQFGLREWRKAATSLICAVRAMNAVYGVQTSERHRDSWLLRACSTYHLAAYALARVGHLRAAVVILEQGRARSIRQALADRGKTLWDDHIWIDIAAAVRGEDSTPLAYLATTAAGSFAMVVHQPSDPARGSAPWIDVVWLRNFADRDLHEFLGAPSDNGEVPPGWLSAYDQWHENPSQNHRSWLEAVEGWTHRLWEGLMEPVVKTIRSLGCERAVLIPSGLLGLLPLHAAWTEQNGRRVYALDYVAFAYAPSARLLTHARQLSQAVLAERLLAVDEPSPVTLGGQLLNSGIEVQAIASLFPTPQVLRHEQATQSRLLEELPRAQVPLFLPRRDQLGGASRKWLADGIRPVAHGP